MRRKLGTKEYHHLPKKKIECSHWICKRKDVACHEHASVSALMNIMQRCYCRLG